MNYKFKKGDRVRSINKDSVALTYGNIYTIHSRLTMTGYGKLYMLKGQGHWKFGEVYFELANEFLSEDDFEL